MAKKKTFEKCPYCCKRVELMPDGKHYRKHMLEKQQCIGSSMRVNHFIIRPDPTQFKGEE